MSKLVLREKLVSPKGLLREKVVWQMEDRARYPHGFKYRLVLVNPINKVVLLVYDDHWPKGPHVHRREKQEPFQFTDLKTLLMSFDIESGEIEEEYDARKEDSN